MAAHVTVRDLGKRYGAQWAVRNVTFDARPGEILGIIGPNGAGKTTTLKMLAGLVSPTEGAADVGGTALDDPELRHRVGYLPEESPLYEDMTPLAYLKFFSDLYGVPKQTGRERIESLLTELKLDVRDEKKIGDMSKGMKRKVAIARALVNDPDLLLFDEPASGLDPIVSQSVLDLVQRQKAAGKTVVFSAHNLYHVERICDRVILIHRGAVVAQGTMAEIRAATSATTYVVRVTVPVEGTVPAEGGFEVEVADFGAVKDLEARVHAAGGRIVDVREKALSLEEIFLRHASG